MYFLLIFYIIFLLGFLGFTGFIIYYTFQLGIGRNAKIVVIGYTAFLAAIILLSLLIISQMEWGWSIDFSKLVS